MTNLEKLRKQNILKYGKSFWEANIWFNPLMLAAAKSCLTILMKFHLGYIYGEFIMKTSSTTSLQIFCKKVLISKIIVTSVFIPDDNFRGKINYIFYKPSSRNHHSFLTVACPDSQVIWLLIAYWLLTIPAQMLSLTAHCLSTLKWLNGFNSKQGHRRKLPVTWRKVVA